MGRKDPRARCFHLPPADPYENIPGHKPCGDAGEGKASMVVPALKLASYFDGIVTHFFTSPISFLLFQSIFVTMEIGQQERHLAAWMGHGSKLVYGGAEKLRVGQWMSRHFM